MTTTDPRATALHCWGCAGSHDTPVPGCPGAATPAPALDMEADFDRAWSAVAAVAPPGYRIDVSWPHSTRENPTKRYVASCRALHDYLGYIGRNDGASTPTKALYALRDALARAALEAWPPAPLPITEDRTDDQKAADGDLR
jgi:hypothetical protein